MGIKEDKLKIEKFELDKKLKKIERIEFKQKFKKKYSGFVILAMVLGAVIGFLRSGYNGIIISMIVSFFLVVFTLFVYEKLSYRKSA